MTFVQDLYAVIGVEATKHLLEKIDSTIPSIVDNGDGTTTITWS